MYAFVSVPVDINNSINTFIEQTGLVLLKVVCG